MTLSTFDKTVYFYDRQILGIAGNGIGSKMMNEFQVFERRERRERDSRKPNPKILCLIFGEKYIF